MSTQPRRIVIATRNRHKTEEFRALLGSEWEVEDMTHHPHLKAPEENGNSFEENAAIKALDASAALGSDALVVADDSGLVVDALRGEPGIFSARYAGTDASDADNRERVLTELARRCPDLTSPSARFHCVLVVAQDGKKRAAFHGSIEGHLVASARGTGGFGYDPLFIPEGYNETFGVLPPTIKNQLSHRARALQQFVNWLCSSEHIP